MLKLKKIEVFDNEKIFTIYIEYYDKSNIEIVKNLEFLNIRNELLPVHYKFEEMIKNNYIKKVIIFSKPKTLNVKLEDLSINDLNNIYKEMKLAGENKQVTLLINNVTKEILYTFDKVYKKEFK